MEPGKSRMESKKSFGARFAGMAWKTTVLVSAIFFPGISLQAQSIDGVTPDLEHGFVEAGGLGFGGVSRALPENQLQAKHAMAAFVSRDSLYLMQLSRSCTGWISGSRKGPLGR